MSKNKSIIIALAIAAAAFISFQTIKPKLVEKAFQKRIETSFAVPAALEDGIHVYVCGAGSPLPDPQRSGPCLGVVAGQQAFIFDAGAGGTRRLGPMGFPIGKTQKIFLTHLHSDHIDGLGEMLMQIWVNGNRTQPLPVAGPVGTQQVVDGFNSAYALDQGYRVAHHGADIVQPSGAGGAAEQIAMTGDSQLVYDVSGVKITASRVTHEPISPAYGYRIDYKGRSVFISGDTSYDPNVAAASQGVDVLFHEALNMEMVGAMSGGAAKAGRVRLSKIFDDITNYHTSPVNAAKTAQAAGAKALVLYHIVPMLPSDALIPMFVKGADDEFDGKITVSKDGLIVRVSVDNGAISYENGL